APGPSGNPDHGADKFTWAVFLLAGDPADPAQRAAYHPGTNEHGAWLSSPDNAATDPTGRLWIATDQGGRQKRNGVPEGLYGMDASGPGCALPRLIYAGPVGSEICGPEFTPDGRTLFLAVQHPGEGSSFDKPTTRWPDFEPTRPPRAAVVVITKKDGGVIGS
ncbi:MAG: alkaline phosphatase PhoX, partial [Rhodospirillaceae bacterium]